MQRDSNSADKYGGTEKIGENEKKIKKITFIKKLKNIIKSQIFN